MVIDVVRRADLLDLAAVHDDHPIGERHRLDLVMGDVDRRRRNFLVHLLDLGAHLDAQFGVEIGQRLVEQEDLGVADDGAAHRDTLALPARQLLRPAAEQVGDVENAGGILDPLLDLGLRKLLQPQTERHVLVHGHVRVERVVLEHHRDVPVLWRHVVDQLVADIDLARGRFLQTGNHPQGRGLAAARWADQHDELAVADVEVDAGDRGGAVEGFDNIAQGDFRHVLLPLGRAGSEAGDVIVHQERIDDQRRCGAEQRSRHDLSPIVHVALDQGRDNADRQDELVG